MARDQRTLGLLVIAACAAAAGLVACADEFTTETPIQTGQGGTAQGGGGAAQGGGGAAQGGAAQGGSGGAAQGGGGAAPACPGDADGCVNDWAGDFSAAGNNDGVGTAARFTALSDITGDDSYLYVTANNAVRRIEIDTATVETWAGSSGQAAYTNGVGTAARFGFVAGITTDGTTVWVVDSGNNVIRAIDIATAAVTTLAGTAGTAGWADGLGAAAQFDGARGITFDGTYLFVVETGNHAVRRIDPTSGAVVTVAGHNGPGATNGAGTVAQFSSPRYVYATGAGELWVGDTENHQVRTVVVTGGGTPTSTVSTAFGAAAGYQEGVGTAALFRRLRGIAYDGTSLVIADSDNYVLRLANLGTSQTSLLAGQVSTTSTAAHSVGIGANAQFDKPMSVYVDPTSHDVFASEGNVIRRMMRP